MGLTPVKSSQYCKLQPITCADSTDSEIYAGFQYAKSSAWIHVLMRDLHAPQQPIETDADNAAMIKISTQDIGLSGKSRHACARKAYVREHCRELRTLVFRQVKSQNNSADMLTKPLPNMEHKRHATSALGKRKLDEAFGPAVATSSAMIARVAG